MHILLVPFLKLKNRGGSKMHWKCQSVQDLKKSINFFYRILSSVACNCNRDVIQQLTFKRRKEKRNRKNKK